MSSERSEANARYKLGYESGAEDRAIGAAWGLPDETLGQDYREGYVDGWRQSAEGHSWSDGV